MANTPNPDLPYWVALNRCLKLGATRFSILRRSFATMREAWAADAKALQAAGLEAGLATELAAHIAKTNVQNSWDELTKLNLQAICLLDDTYPKLLKQIYDPPPVLYYRGDINCLQTTCLAVVGARNASSYGLKATEELIGSVAIAGVTIISGLAYGIDAAAHRSALNAGGLTAAVLAGGLDNVYPTAHTGLADTIVKNSGCIMSEFPPGTAAFKQNFPLRNRIIAGLAQATLVVEATPDSGSLITAKHALEQNREVLAVPGNIFVESSQGTNELLKQGAHLVTTAQDIMNVLGLGEITSIRNRPELTAAQKNILELVPSEPQHINNLVQASGLSTAELLAQLTQLEMAGYVQATDTNFFSRIS